MEEIIQGLNEPVAAEPVEQVEQVEQGAEVQEVAEPVEQKPVQDAETNARFADVRRRAEQVGKDSLIRELYGHQGINSYAEYQEALQRQEWEQQGKDPELEELKQEMMSFRREKTLLTQREALKEEPFFNDWLPEIEELVQGQPDVYDYDVAYTIMARQKMRDIMTQTAKSAEQEAVKGLIQNATTATGPLGGEGPDMKHGYSNMTSSEKRAFREKVKRGEL